MIIKIKTQGTKIAFSKNFRPLNYFDFLNFAKKGDKGLGMASVCAGLFSDNAEMAEPIIKGEKE